MLAAHVCPYLWLHVTQLAQLVVHSESWNIWIEEAGFILKIPANVRPSPWLGWQCKVVVPSLSEMLNIEGHKFIICDYQASPSLNIIDYYYSFLLMCCSATKCPYYFAVKRSVQQVPKWVYIEVRLSCWACYKLKKKLCSICCMECASSWPVSTNFIFCYFTFI